MWLLDVNLPNGLVKLLKDFGFSCDTTSLRGWRNLGNGKLVEAASNFGFNVILTRDRLFGESAGKALKRFPHLVIVILRIPQSREITFQRNFEINWYKKPISPIFGQIIEWPETQGSQLHPVIID